MSDSLRDRIAAAVDERIKFWRDEQGYVVDGIDGADVADAVIAALQLTEDGGVIVGCIHD